MGLFDFLKGPNINELYEQYQQETNAVLIDVRSAGEFDMGHIPGAVNIPLETVDSALKRYPNKKLYLYCLSGARSRSAVSRLVSLGAQEVLNMGGINSWKGSLER